MAARVNNQALRTRKDLLRAANRLLNSGARPSIEEVAAEALVSRATAYRHFPNVDALLAEAVIDAAVLEPEAIFANDTSDDPLERIDKAEASMHEFTFRKEAQLRIALAYSVGRTDLGPGQPRRQNRRIPLIQEALRPARNRLNKKAYERLCAALAMVFGAESMIVFRDVLGADERTARQTKSWAARALVRAALEEAAKIPPSAGQKRKGPAARGRKLR